MNNFNSVNIPMKTSYFIKMTEYNNYEKAEIKPYQQLIKKLIYLSFSTRLDIAFAIRQVNKHNLDPKIGHITVIKKVVH